VTRKPPNHPVPWHPAGFEFVKVNRPVNPVMLTCISNNSIVPADPSVHENEPDTAPIYPSCDSVPE